MNPRIAFTLIAGSAFFGYAQGSDTPLVIRLEAPLVGSKPTKIESTEQISWVLVLEGVRAPADAGYQITVRNAGNSAQGAVLGTTSIVASPGIESKAFLPRTLVLPLSVEVGRLLSTRSMLELSISVDFVGPNTAREVTIERAYVRRTK